MRSRTRVRQDPPADALVAGDALLRSDPAVLPAAGDLKLPSPGDLELPAPVRLALTAGWNLAESLGLPLAAYAVGERLGGQGPGMAAAGMVWLTAAARTVLAGSIPRLLAVSGLVLTLQAVLVLATGSVLFFLAWTRGFPARNRRRRQGWPVNRLLQSHRWQSSSARCRACELTISSVRSAGCFAPPG